MTYLFKTQTIRTTRGARRIALIVRPDRAMPVFISSNPLTALAVYQLLTRSI